MTLDPLAHEKIFKESMEYPSFIPPASSSAQLPPLPNPAPATKTEYGAGVGKTAGGIGERRYLKDVETEEGIFAGQRKKRSMKLTEIDQKILGQLERWGALGLGQIEGIFGGDERSRSHVAALFFNESFKYAGRFYLRMRTLEKRGLVQVQRAINAKQVYRLTAWGHAALRKAGAAKLPCAPRSISPSTLEHRVLYVGCGLTLSLFLGLKVQSEREFYQTLKDNLGGKKPAGYHLPDVVVLTPEGRCPIEVELHLKSEETYFSLWSFYQDKLASKDKLLYLASTPKMATDLLKLAKKLRADFLYASDLASFRAHGGKSDFRNFQGATFRF